MGAGNGARQPGDLIVDDTELIAHVVIEVAQSLLIIVLLWLYLRLRALVLRGPR